MNLPSNHGMRRSDREIPEAEARALLAKADHGFLATIGADGWPYVVPLNHVLDGDRLYIHGAQTGHKLENLAHEPRVSYCAIDQVEVLPSELTTHYTSVIAFGRAQVVQDADERLRVMERFGQRFSQGFEAQVQETIRKYGNRVSIVRIDIERITGKSNRE